MHSAMKNALIPTIIACLLWTLNPANAHADSWLFGMAAGPSARPSGDLDVHLKANTVAAGRFFGGLRLGNWSFEAAVFGSDLTSRNGDHKRTHIAIGGDVRRFMPVARRTELFVRFGLDYNTLGGKPQTELSGFGGPGVHYGAGVQTSFGVSGGAVKLYVELGQQRLRLHKTGFKSLDGAFTTMTFGIVLSKDWHRPRTRRMPLLKM